MSVQKTVQDPLAEVAALTCSETEALLQVKYNITQDEWDSSRPKYQYSGKPFLYLQGDWVKYYRNFASVKNYEACLPRDECVEVIVGGLPTDAYGFSFDGKAVDIGPEFIFDGTNPVTSTKVGACTKPPTCKETEALMEIQYWEVFFGNEYYRVEDKDGGTVLFSKPGERGGNGYYGYTLNQTYACLPKDDACYTFLIGSEYQFSFITHPPPSYSVIFDGKLVRRGDSWLFDSVQFGGSCKPQCNQDTESLVEFFLYDYDHRWPSLEYEYEWDLNVKNSDSSSTLVSGVVPKGPGISPLSHKIMCVPKGSCSSFYISAPNVTREVTRNETFSLSPVYTLTMENVTYRKGTWHLPERDGYGSDRFGSNNETINMGTCIVGGLCDEETQDLFELGLRTAATNYWPLFDRSQMRWNFGYTEYGRDQYLLQNFGFFNAAYDLDSSYEVIECVPKDGCDLSFNISSREPVHSYTVKKNGIQLENEQVAGQYELMTPFGQECKPPLSGGAIAGIVVACIVAVGAITFSLVWRNRRQNQSSEEGEEDPLRESLL